MSEPARDGRHESRCPTSDGVAEAAPLANPGKLAAQKPIRLVEANSVAHPEVEFEDEGKWPKLPDGEYVAKLVRHEATPMRMFRGAIRLFAEFEIMTGDYSGKCIYGAWPVERKASADGRVRFVVRDRSDIHMILCRLFDRRVRPDRITLAPLKRCLLRIKTRTVKRNHRQREYPECLRYSVVDDIIAIEAGEP